mmetsp:Transcript_15028/g.35429  ORF Transcript_15028/g.35429 Transcript_15028/m.35429 type:complete len:298 (-) Transcript_15028:633-1526(-)
MGVGGNELVGDGDALNDLDARLGDGVVLHVTHRYQLVDLSDAQPVQRVGHQLLESHVFNARHTRGAMEVGLRPVSPLLPLPGVVHKELGHLAQAPALLPEVDNHAHASLLCSPDALLDAVDEVGSARADVGAKDIRAVALVVHSDSARLRGVAAVLGGPEDVDSLSADGREEDVDVGARDELREHSSCLLEHGAPKRGLRDPKPLCHAWKVPHVLDGSLGSGHGSVGHQQLVVCLESPLLHSIDQLQHLDVRLRHGDGRADVDVIAQVMREVLGDEMPPRVHADHLGWVVPRGRWRN